MKIIDFIAEWIGAIVLTVLGLGAAVAMFGPPMHGDFTVDSEAGEDQAAEDDPGAGWDRGYDRAVDESNGVV